MGPQHRAAKAAMAALRTIVAMLMLCCSAVAFQAAPLRSSVSTSRAASSSISMKRICDVTCKKANNVTFSNTKNARLQHVNLQKKNFFSPELNRNVRLKVATSTMRTITKLGLDETAKKYGCDLSKF